MQERTDTGGRFERDRLLYLAVEYVLIPTKRRRHDMYRWNTDETDEAEIHGCFSFVSVR